MIVSEGNGNGCIRVGGVVINSFFERFFGFRDKDVILWVFWVSDGGFDC